MNIIIEKNELTLDYKRFVFSGGEVSVKLADHQYKFWSIDAPIWITARIQNSEDAFALAHIVDAIRQNDNQAEINLQISYFPYARQDRVCATGESFALKVFARFINSLGFNNVHILDPHSDVTPALIDNASTTSQVQLFGMFDALNKFILTTPNVRFVSPDAGANKKTSELAKLYGHDSFIRADKLRNLNTGAIIETIVYAGDLKGVTAVIADDIADGGATFTALAKALKTKGADKVILYVTHGIFSKGFDALFENGIDHIYTTDSFRQDIQHDKVTVLKV